MGAVQEKLSLSLQLAVLTRRNVSLLWLGVPWTPVGSHGQAIHNMYLDNRRSFSPDLFVAYRSRVVHPVVRE